MFVEDTNFSEPEDPRDSSDQVESPSHRAASQQVALTSPGEESLEREREVICRLCDLLLLQALLPRGVSPLKKGFLSASCSETEIQTQKTSGRDSQAYFAQG